MIIPVSEFSRVSDAKARQIAKNQKTELIIHGKDGKIQDKNSFGNDPYPPKDKKH